MTASTRCAAAFLLAAATPLGAQDLNERIGAAGDGTVGFYFAAKEGVCGWGGSGFSFSSSGNISRGCERGPVRVLIRIDGGRVQRVDSYVSGIWRRARPDTDLGEVDAREAADYLLEIADDRSHRDGDEAISAAALGYGVTIWPRLLQLARDRDLYSDARSSAIFWLGQEASTRAVEGLRDLAESDEDVEIRKSAVFALSERADGEGIPHLIRIALENESPEVRKSALFWLADSEDPRAIDLFEQILSGSNRD